MRVDYKQQYPELAQKAFPTEEGRRVCLANGKFVGYQEISRDKSRSDKKQAIVFLPGTPG